MKSCPVCNGKCFDDMPICFSCMYHFDDEVNTPGDEDLDLGAIAEPPQLIEIPLIEASSGQQTEVLQEEKTAPLHARPISYNSGRAILRKNMVRNRVPSHAEDKRNSLANIVPGTSRYELVVSIQPLFEDEARTELRLVPAG